MVLCISPYFTITSTCAFPDVNPQARLLTLGYLRSVVSLRQGSLDSTRSRIPMAQLYNIWGPRRSHRPDGKTRVLGREKSANPLELGLSPPGRPPTTFGQAARAPSKVITLVVLGYETSR